MRAPRLRAARCPAAQQNGPPLQQVNDDMRRGTGNYRGAGAPLPHSHAQLGSFASRDFDICQRNYCDNFAGCGYLQILSCSIVILPTSIAEICRDDESTQKLRRQISKSWLVKFPAW